MDRRFVAAAVALVWLALGCQGVSREKITAWKVAADGPDHLVKVVRTPDVAADLRVLAGSALIAVGRVDRMEAAVSSLALEDRGQIISGIVATLALGAAGTVAGNADDRRDALFALRQQATTEAVTRAVDALLLPVLEADIRANRAGSGHRTPKEMLLAIGRPVLPRLLTILDDGQAPFVTTVEVLQKVGDASSRAAGGAALVRRARRDKQVVPPLYASMALLGGQPVVEFLAEQLSLPAAALQAADTMVTMKGERLLLPVALKKAGDAALAPALRERMVQIAENLGGEGAWQGLVALIAAERSQPFAYRLFKAAFTAGGGAALAAALEAFPLDVAYSPADVKEKVVTLLAATGPDLRQGLFAAIEGRSPLSRMVALWMLEQSRFKGDADFATKLSKDKGAIKGFGRGQTVGAEAARITALLQKEGH